MKKQAGLIIAWLLSAGLGYAAESTDELVERVAVPMVDILDQGRCLQNFQQVNHDEPIALCSFPVRPSGKVRILGIEPMGRMLDLDTTLDGDIGCSVGILRQSPLEGQIQLSVSLSPYRRDYPREQFVKCFEYGLSLFKSQDKKAHLEIVRK